MSFVSLQSLLTQQYNLDPDHAHVVSVSNDGRSDSSDMIELAIRVSFDQIKSLIQRKCDSLLHGCQPDAIRISRWDKTITVSAGDALKIEFSFIVSGQLSSEQLEEWSPDDDARDYEEDE
jgi:hypothetical protein